MDDKINYVRKQANYRDTVINRLEAMNRSVGSVFDCSEGVSIKANAMTKLLLAITPKIIFYTIEE